MRVHGFGFKTISRPLSRTSKRVLRFLAVYNKGRLPTDLWIGRGKPLNPYLHGQILELLRRWMRPRELIVPPEEIFLSPVWSDFLDWTCLRSWCSEWVGYLKWYHTLQMSYQPTIDDYLNGPVVNHKWWSDQTDPTLVRFGFLWKIYDLYHRMELVGRDYILSPSVSAPGYVLGGADGSFLISAWGLEQPSAGKKGSVVCPGVNLLYGQQHPSVKTIHYKTLGVSDRQCVTEFT